MTATADADTADDEFVTAPTPDSNAQQIRSEDRARQAAGTIDLTELVVLGAVTGAAVLSWVALALAQWGAYSFVPTVAITVGVGAVVLFVARRGSLHVERTIAGAALAGLTLLASLVMFLPGFPYAIVDKDPGVYVAHGASIAHEGSIEVPDDVRVVDPNTALIAPGARFSGLWTEESLTTVTPQFFHLYPALLAVANGVGGVPLSFHVNPVLAALSVTALALAVRRVAGMTAGALTSAFLLTNMLEVWQAKFPTTEILTQMLVAGALLAGVVAMQTRWRAFAALSGVLAGLTFLARPDGLVVILLAAAVAAVAHVAKPSDTGPRWFALGLGLTLPHGLFNAYDLRRSYSLANDLPSFTLTAVALAVLAIGAVAAAGVVRAIPALRTFVDPGRPAWSRAATIAAPIGAVGLAAVMWFFRNRAHGDQLFFDYNGTSVRSYDELNFVRLSFYWPLRAMALTVLGVVAIGLWKRHAATWVAAIILLPTLPVYLWAAKNSPRLMWWGRRYLPTVLPALVILGAIGAAWLLVKAPTWVKIPVAVLVASVVWETAATSLPLHDHREFAGTYDLGVELAGLTGDGVLIWDKPPGGDLLALNRHLPAAMWLIHDLPNIYLDAADPQAALDAASRVRPGAPIYFLVPDDAPPPAVAGTLAPVASFTHTLVFWEEKLEELPDEPDQRVRSIDVYLYERPA